MVNQLPMHCVAGLDAALAERAAADHTHDAAGHTHDAAQIVSGIIAPERLGEGIASAMTTLHGDGTWKVAEGGSGGSGGSGLFRGEWATDALVRTYDFADDALPAGFAFSQSGSGAAAAVESVPAGSPFTRGARLASGSIHSSTFARLTFTPDSAETGLGAVTRIVAWWHRPSSGQLLGNKNAHSRRGESLVTTIGNAFAWQQTTVPLNGAADASWEDRGATSAGSNSTTAHIFVTGVQVYAVAEPYRVGEYVAHRGRLWRCDVAGTSQEPGTGSAWVQVPIGYDRAVATASRPTGVTAGARIFDTTLGKPVWWNGSAWVDATGATV